MPLVPTPSLFLLFAIWGGAAEPPTPDPLPAPVRQAIAQRAGGRSVGEIGTIQRHGERLYVVQLEELHGDRPWLLILRADGTLAGDTPLTEPPRLEIPPVPTVDPADRTKPLPVRPDGKDADPATRRGRDPSDHS